MPLRGMRSRPRIQQKVDSALAATAVVPIPADGRCPQRRSPPRVLRSTHPRRLAIRALRLRCLPPTTPSSGMLSAQRNCQRPPTPPPAHARHRRLPPRRLDAPRPAPLQQLAHRDPTRASRPRAAHRPRPPPSPVRNRRPGRQRAGPGFGRTPDRLLRPIPRHAAVRRGDLLRHEGPHRLRPLRGPAGRASAAQGGQGRLELHAEEPEGTKDGIALGWVGIRSRSPESTITRRIIEDAQRMAQSGSKIVYGLRFDGHATRGSPWLT